MSDQLSSSILHQLHQTVRLLTKRMNQILEPFGLFAAEWPILLLLQTTPLTQVELSEQLHIEPPAVSKTLQNLEKKGVIARKPGDDRRQKLAHLTAHGLQIYKACLTQVEAERQQLVTYLSPEEGRQLIYLLQQVQAGAMNRPIESEESSHEFTK